MIPLQSVDEVTALADEAEAVAFLPLAEADADADADAVDSKTTFPLFASAFLILLISSTARATNSSFYASEGDQALEYFKAERPVPLVASTDKESLKAVDSSFFVGSFLYSSKPWTFSETKTCLRGPKEDERVIKAYFCASPFAEVTALIFDCRFLISLSSLFFFGVSQTCALV